MLLWTLLFCFVLEQTTSLTPTHSTVGNHFVVAFPYAFSVRYHAGDIHILNTENKKTTVTVTQPLRLRDRKYVVRNVTTHVLQRFASTFQRVPNSLHLPYTVFGIFYGIIVKSKGYIKVFAFFSSRHTTSEAYVAIPETSCYRSYYVTTGIGHPSILVFSFNQTTTIKITIPKYKNYFAALCTSKGYYCRPTGKATVVLEPYKLWYLQVQSKTADLHNTLITSDKPIFVVSGNGNCNYIRPANELCYSNMKPTATWGKEYYVPNLPDFKGYVPFYLRFNAKSWPLKLMIHQGSQHRSVVIANHEEFREYRQYTEPIVLTGDVPFGLYFFLPSYTPKVHNYDATLLSVIPSEQWKIGSVYVKNDLEEYCDKHSFLVAIKTPKVLERASNNSKTTEWTFATNANFGNYYYRYMDMRQLPANNFHIIGDMDKSILYIRGSKDKATAFIIAYDYYQGEIYNPNCKKTALRPGDGVDNDCDGNIDEERMNGEDDDRDFLKDEDTARQFFSNGSGLWKADFDNHETNGGDSRDKKPRKDTTRPEKNNNKQVKDNNKEEKGTEKQGGDNNKQGKDNSTHEKDNSTPGKENSTPVIDNSTPGKDNSAPGKDNSTPGKDNSKPTKGNETEDHASVNNGSRGDIQRTSNASINSEDEHYSYDYNYDDQDDTDLKSASATNKNSGKVSFVVIALAVFLTCTLALFILCALVLWYIFSKNERKDNN